MAGTELPWGKLFKLGRFVFTNVLADITAAVKTAARRRFYGARYVAFKDYMLPLYIYIWYWNCREQGFGVGMEGVCKQGLIIRHFNDFSQVHNSYIVADMLDYT